MISACVFTFRKRTLPPVDARLGSGVLNATLKYRTSGDVVRVCTYGTYRVCVREQIVSIQLHVRGKRTSHIVLEPSVRLPATMRAPVPDQRKIVPCSVMFLL